MSETPKLRPRAVGVESCVCGHRAMEHGQYSGYCFARVGGQPNGMCQCCGFVGVKSPPEEA